MRVIHGKGLGSKNREPVLKVKVKLWLQKRQEVLAFCQAPPVQGGGGALLVLLACAGCWQLEPEFTVAVEPTGLRIMVRTFGEKGLLAHLQRLEQQRLGGVQQPGLVRVLGERRELGRPVGLVEAGVVAHEEETEPVQRGGGHGQVEQQLTRSNPPASARKCLMRQRCPSSSRRRRPSPESSAMIDGPPPL